MVTRARALRSGIAARSMGIAGVVLGIVLRLVMRSLVLVVQRPRPQLLYRLHRKLSPQMLAVVPRSPERLAREVHSGIVARSMDTGT